MRPVVAGPGHLAPPLTGAPGLVLAVCGLGLFLVSGAVIKSRHQANFLQPSQQAEPAALAASDGAAARDGGTLSIRTAAGPVVLANREACGQNGGVVSDENCITFVYRRHDMAHHGFLVLVGFYQGDEYAWVDDRSGHVTALQGEPHFSPSGRTLVLIRSAESDAVGGIQLWSAEGLKPVWNYEAKGDALYSFDRWSGEDRVVMHVSTLVDGKEVESRARLMKTGDGWKIRPAP